MLLKKNRILWAVFITLLFTSCSHQQKTQKSYTESNPLLLISFDGFRYDYLSKTDTPYFDDLVKNGVKSEGLIPVFPSKTFPNHYAIVTGLYPENNGLISNNMLDPKTGDRYRISDREAVENAKWYQGEPIWNTVEKQGKKAGTMFWVGSEAPIQDMRPTHWKIYDESLPDSARVDTVISWLTGKGTTQVDFASLYFSFTDTQGHRFGPYSPELIQAVQHADDLIGYLQKQLKENQLLEKTNLIIVSDHGMAEVSRDRIIVLDDLMNIDLIDEITDLGAIAMMNIKDGGLEKAYQSLKQNQDHYRVFKKKEIPDRFHLKNNPRVPQLLIMPDIGYTVNTRQFFDTHPGYPSGGAHGYDNNEEEMHGLFLAHGPAFREGIQVKKFQNIHLYDLMSHLLAIEPEPTDGVLDSVSVVFQ